MNKLSLFSGIGGDDIASEMAGIQTICFVEIDLFCQKVLRKHWPNIPIIGDVKDVTKEKVMAYAEVRGIQARAIIPSQTSTIGGLDIERCGHHGAGVDIISGGFPCQPHSVAGRRKGSSDERNLWPEFRRCIEEIRPRWVVAENVPGLLSSDDGHFFGSILSDLASLGYACGWATYGAVDVGALHRRDRIFIVAYASNDGFNKYDKDSIPQRQLSPLSEQSGRRRASGTQGCRQDVADTAEQGLQESRLAGEWEQGTEGEERLDNRPSLAGSGPTESRLGRMVDGLSYWMDEPDIPRVAVKIPDRVNRLKALGNAVVPQQVYLIYKAIVEAEGG